MSCRGIIDLSGSNFENLCDIIGYQVAYFYHNYSICIWLNTGVFGRSEIKSIVVAMTDIFDYKSMTINVYLRGILGNDSHFFFITRAIVFKYWIFNRVVVHNGNLMDKLFTELNKNPVEGFSAGLIDDNDIYRWEVLIIGPPDTL